MTDNRDNLLLCVKYEITFFLSRKGFLDRKQLSREIVSHNAVLNTSQFTVKGENLNVHTAVTLTCNDQVNN